MASTRDQVLNEIKVLGQASVAELAERVGLTAVAVRRGERLWERLVDTEVKVKALSNAEVNAYLASGEWEGKAGAYAIQGHFGAMIPWLKGSFTGVVGLPVAETAHLLAAAGVDVHGAWGGK